MKISVVVIVRNEEKFIRHCLEGILGQSVRDFEVVVIDNGSTDGTDDIIRSFDDGRIRYYRDEGEPGMAELRNRGIRRSSGEYVFFTDGDCVPYRHWLEEGLAVLEGEDVVGVEGKTYYEAPQMVTISDWNVRQLTPGAYMTCNVAYARSVLDGVNGFDPAFRRGHEDRDLAFRVLDHGRIGFSGEMLVAHQRKTLTPRALFDRAKRADDLVYFIKKHGHRTDVRRSIVYPQRLLAALCPPLLLLTNSYKTPHDLLLGFAKYGSIVYERALIWRAAVKHGVFVL